MQSFEQAWSFVAALAGDPNTAVIDMRAIHDTDKADKGHARRGTLGEWWQWLCEMNNAGYGIFMTIAAMDGNGLHLTNVWYLRAHYTDLDEGDAQQQYEKACQAYPTPSFAVQSSPGKFHVYWPVQYYQGNDRFQLVQRKLRQLFNGDKRVIDAARVMRMPGTLHMKNPAAPHLVQMWSLGGWCQQSTVDQLESALQSVNVIDGAVGTRHDLGEPSLAAPSLHWIGHALALTDPNDLDRGEWIALTAAIKQAGWSLTDEATLFAMWSEWCARYEGIGRDGKPYANDPGENLKQWNSIHNSELGWPSLCRRVPSLQASLSFNGVDRSGAVPSPAPVANLSGTAGNAPPMPINEPPSLDCSGEFLTHVEQQSWFKGCVFIENMGVILTPKGRFFGPTQFNGAYGGKQFIVDSVGKKSNEAWAAATRSTLWTIPKVDHTRFVPTAGHGELITDELGRTGVNIYRPATIVRTPGDPSPFLNHIAMLLPNPADQRIILDYLAHNARFPGHKIPWSPVIQSTEGAGKGVLKKVMRHVMGKPYVYYPKASELATSGATFNKWLRHRLFILVDEVKVDERRELIEVLKPLISEEETEIQAKGVDQDLEDNFSNWLFFTNWRDAIPVSKNARRFAIMYSPLQTVDDLLARGMGEAYFNALYDWLDNGGSAIVADWLLNYPIERGAIPKRAPTTTSTAEAIDLSRGPVERLILEAVEDGISGFRGGWISATAVLNRIKVTGAVRAVSPQTVATIIEGLGYVSCGRAPRPYFQEDRESRPYLFHFGQRADMEGYGRLQGYE